MYTPRLGDTNFSCKYTLICSYRVNENVHMPVTRTEA